MIAYNKTSKLLTGQQVLLTPHSKTRFSLPSFCLDPNLIAPSNNEAFYLKKDSPQMPLSYSELLKNASYEADLQNKYQEIIWNLRNKVLYEDYPEDSKNILNRIDPNAKFKLPSQAKSILIEESKSILRKNLPNGAIFEEDWSLVEGKYYRYQEIKAAIQKRGISADLQSDSVGPIDRMPYVFIESKSNGFSNQTVTFLNSSDSFQNVNLGNFYLAPFNKNVQRIALYAGQSQYQSLSKMIEDILRDSIINNSMYWYGGRLTPEEIKLIHDHPHDHPIDALNVYLQAEKTKVSTLKYFAKDAEDDESDAFRHFVWAGLVTQQLGETLARQFLEAHESLPANKAQDFHARQAREMDLYNDDRGIVTAKTLDAKEQLGWKRLEEEALENLKNGNLKVTKSSQSPRYLNGDK